MFATVQNRPSFAKRAFFQERKSHSIAPKSSFWKFKIKIHCSAKHIEAQLRVCLFNVFNFNETGPSYKLSLTVASHL